MSCEDFAISLEDGYMLSQIGGASLVHKNNEDDAEALP